MEGINISAPGYQTGHIQNHWVDWGIFAFFDAKYAEVEAGYYRPFFGNYEQSDFGYPLDAKSNYDDIKISYLDLGLSLKYPIKYSKYVLTPMIGFSYWINLSDDYGYKTILDAVYDIKKTDWDQMWVKVGLSVDSYLTEKIYLRPAAKLNFPIVTKDWKNRGSGIKDALGTVISGTNSKYSGVGAEFSLSVGYRIK
ncbi:MAG: hypothetical protein LBI94_05190 [Treponema sp.]|jgi:hypothetical protein|nr:hypothetical protein [Treponema sp.]